MRLAITFAVLLMAAASPANAGESAAAAPNDIDVSVALDAAEQSGSASATVRIRASREVVWSLITSCPESLALVPGLEVCEIVETAPDHSWQRIRHVMNYSWFVPRVAYQFHASYEPPTRVSIERISGDLRTLRGSWVLTSDGDYTLAHYTVDLAPGFWVPRWVVSGALRHDLPKMLRALRTRAEAVQGRTPG